MKNLLPLLLKPAVVASVGLLAALFAVWFGMTVLVDLLPWLPRSLPLLAVIAVVVTAVLIMLWRRMRARAKATQIEQQLRGQTMGAGSARPDRAADVQELQRKFDEALSSLKNSRLGRSALHALPWYVIIGPPGSGKTTMLVESGLHFPSHMNRDEGRGIKGIGGTRNCDWWFSDQAILLDTAGRYTTQDEDRDEWMSFLGLLARARRGKPINGAFVAISVEELLESNEQQIAAHAELIRSRLDELTKSLELIFPVYVVFTKCDKLDGFVQFFEGMNADQRGQVFGCTPSAATLAQKAPHTIFAEEFDLLERRLRLERLALLATDRAKAKQRKVFTFPMQFALAKAKLTDFVEQLTKKDPFHETAEIRGFYFTSGTQEGAAIDRVLESMGAAFGLEQERNDQLEPPERKSYFIRDLFTKVVFPEQHLARSSAGAEKRRRVARLATIVGSVAATLFLAVWMFLSFFDVRSVAASGASAVAALDAAAEFPSDGPPDEARRRRLEGLRVAFAAMEELRVSPLRLFRPSRDAYDHVRRPYVEELGRIFLAPAAEALRDQLSAFEADRSAERPASKAEVERASEMVRAYRMLGAPEADPSELWQWLRDLNCWRFDRRQLLDPRAPPLAENDEQLRHLRTFGTAIVRGDDWRPIYDAGLARRVETMVSAADAVSTAVRGTVSEEQLRVITPGNLDEAAREIGMRLAVDPDQRSVVEQRAKAQLTEAARHAQTKAVRDAIAAPATTPQTLRAVLTHMDTLLPAGSVTEPWVRQAQVAFDKLQEFDFKEPNNPDWHKRSRELLEKLRSDLSVFLGPGDAGRRVLPTRSANDVPRLSGFLVGLDQLGKDFEDLMDKNAADTIGRAAKRGFLDLIEQVRMALQAELEAECANWWKDDVVPRLAPLADRFPFVPTAQEEADLTQFVALFRKDGIYQKVLDVLRDLTRVEARGRPLLRFGAGFAAEVQWFERLQQDLFADGGDRMRHAVRVLRMEVPVAAYVKLTIGKRSLASHLVGMATEAQRTVVYESDALEKAALVVGVAVSGGKVEDRPFPLPAGIADGWRLFRLCHAATQDLATPGELRLHWKLEVVEQSGTKTTLEPSIVIAAPVDRLSPFAREYFARSFVNAPFGEN